MTYSLPFLRLQVVGTLYGVETFSWGLSFINDFGTGTPPTAVPTGVHEAIKTFHQKSHISQWAALDYVKLNQIGTDGRYTSPSDTVEYEYPSKFAGGSTATNVAPQVALAVTLRTNARRGRASRGRFYLPMPTATIGSDGRIAAGSATAIAADVKIMLDSIEEALPGWDLGVVSKVGSGAQKAVTHVDVGRTLDTIRSRRTSIPEGYVVGEDLAGDA